MPKITPYINGEATLTNFINYMYESIIGFMRASIVGLKDSSTYLISVNEGSLIESNQYLYYFESVEWGELTTVIDTKIYFYVNRNTGEIGGTGTAPVWDSTFQGYYGATGDYVNYRHFAVITLFVAGGAILKTELMDSMYYESYR